MPVEPVSLQDKAELLQKHLGPSLEACAIDLGELVIATLPATLLDVLSFVKDHPLFRFTQLMDVCGVDYLARFPRFDVVYNLLSLTQNQRLRLKVGVNENESLPSACGLFSSAGWFEREVFDLFGISFADHPDLRRILTDYGFDGHPLRKDFPLTGYVEVRYDLAEKKVVYEPVNLPQEFRTFDFLSPWEGMTNVMKNEGKA